MIPISEDVVPKKLTIKESFELATSPPRSTLLTTLLEQQRIALEEYGEDHPLVILYGESIARWTAIAFSITDRLREAHKVARKILEEE